MPYTFLSYSAADRHPSVDLLISTLTDEIRGHLGRVETSEVLFRDSSNVQPGSNWSQELMHALRECDTFIYLHSPAYFQSDGCGKEYAFVQRRLSESRRGTLCPIIPILWIPTSPEDYLPHVQFTFDAFGEDYRRKGLRRLAITDQAEFIRVVAELGGLIAKAAKGSPLPRLQSVISWSELKSPFRTERKFGADKNHSRRTSVLPRAEPVALTVSASAYFQTALVNIGKAEGIFSHYGIDAHIEHVPWHGQIDRLRVRNSSRSHLDVGMAALSEVARTDRLSREYGAQNSFFLPTWQFTALTFYSSQDVKTPDECGYDVTPEEALRQFFDSLANKWICLPRRTAYEDALRALALRSGGDWDDLNIADCPIESSMRAAKRPGMALVAVGSRHIQEMVRYGYKLALSSKHLGATTIGFVAAVALRDRLDVLASFVCAWYEVMSALNRNRASGFEIVSSYLRKHGLNPSFEEFRATLDRDEMPSQLDAARQLFLTSDSPAYWKKEWNRTAHLMTVAGEGADVPADDSAFIFDELASLIESRT